MIRFTLLDGEIRMISIATLINLVRLHTKDVKNNLFMKVSCTMDAQECARLVVMIKNAIEL